MQYSKWGYTIKPEQMANGQWEAVGHKSGSTPYVLHKLGTATTEDEMQRKLMSWARHVLATPVQRKADVVMPEGMAVELELFPARVGCVV
jgi:hypothetical protein